MPLKLLQLFFRHLNLRRKPTLRKIAPSSLFEILTSSVVSLIFSEQYVAHQITSLQKSSTNKGMAVNLIYGP